MTPYRYDIPRIAANPLNRINAKHIAELVQYADRDLQLAKRMSHATAAQIKAKDQAVSAAQQLYDERAQKYHLYKKLYPDLFNAS